MEAITSGCTKDGSNPKLATLNGRRPSCVEFREATVLEKSLLHLLVIICRFCNAILEDWRTNIRGDAIVQISDRVLDDEFVWRWLWVVGYCWIPIFGFLYDS